MIKTYKLNMQMNNAHIILTGKSGNQVVYDFINGNIVTNTPARIIVSGKYEQDLLEECDAFKKRYILLERVEKTPEEISAEEAAEQKKQEEKEEDSMEKVEDVTNPVDAIAYIAENFGIPVKTAKEAKKIAKENGIVFPNLKIGKANA